MSKTFEGGKEGGIPKSMYGREERLSFLKRGGGRG